MRHEQFAKRRLFTIVLTAVVIGMLGASGLAWKNPLKGRYLSGGPLSICDEGSFFVGGVPKVTRYASSAAVREGGPPQQITIGQMYVQFQIPEQRRRWPLIMIHGSTHTGAALDSTPGGRRPIRVPQMDRRQPLETLQARRTCVRTRRRPMSFANEAGSAHVRTESIAAGADDIHSSLSASRLNSSGTEPPTRDADP